MKAFKGIEDTALLKAQHPEAFANIDIEMLRLTQQVKLQKDLAQQSSIFETILETHTECSNLLQEVKEQCSNLIKDGPKKFIGIQPQDVLKTSINRQTEAEEQKEEVSAMLKGKIIDSICKSGRDLGTGQSLRGKVVFPDFFRIRAMTLEQIRNLSITKVQWYQDCLYTLGFTLSDGQTCRAGP